MKHEVPVGRRRFLQGAAVSAAALVAKSAPMVAGDAQDSTAPRSAAPPNAQLAADTDPPPRRAGARAVEPPASALMVRGLKTPGVEYRGAKPGERFEGLHES